MSARMVTALVLLAGVLAVHGLQCADGADAASGHVSGSAAMIVLPAGHVVAAVDGIDGTLHRQSATVGGAAAPGDSRHHGGPYEASAGLWAVCLAVLAAGFAMLLGVRAPRGTRLLPRVLAGGRARRAGVLAPLRPPDLSALCLLRI